jgi:4-hydroxy-3-methylbut-2-enyl diphosphate reductase IspH
MSTSSSFLYRPIEKLEEALNIRKQIGALQDKLNTLVGPEVSSTAAKLVHAVKKRTRTMSVEARERIAAAQRARWAKVKGTSAASTPAKKPKAKRNISPEARAKMAAAAKKRWAAVKAK